MRGKGSRSSGTATCRRITPARAGKRASAWGRTERARDHPRACGEKKNGVVSYIGTWGSPPRVRGKAGRPLCLCRRRGITPARAGKRVAQVDRVRGRKGSPPRVRGKENLAIGFVCRHGITPARAGKRLKKSRKINDPSPLAHRISFSFSYTANVRRQSVSARCAPETSRPKYAASVVSL